MSFPQLTIQAFAKLIQRNRTMSARIKALEKRVAKLDRQSAGVIQSELYPSTAPGSPVWLIGEWIVGRVTGEHEDYPNERIYAATVQEATAHGEWADTDTTVCVIGYPRSGHGGNYVSDRPTMRAGQYVLIRWEGRDETHEQEAHKDFYHAFPISFEQNAAGVITSCDKDSGLCKVKLAEGVMNYLLASGEEVDAYIGIHPWHREGDNVALMHMGPGITPAYIVVDKIRGFHWEPLTSEETAPHTVPGVDEYCEGCE